MKKSILVMIVMAFISMSSQAQTKKTETFKVYGNCGMCETKIEGALNGKNGIYKADWDQKTKQMTVTYNADKITLSEVKQKIADVGYDTDSHRAKKETYDNLHGCCKYERPAKQHKATDHKH